MKEELEKLIKDLEEAEKAYDEQKYGSMLKMVHEAARKARRLLDTID